MNAVPFSCEDATDLAAGFVLGALEPAEMDAVRGHLASCGRPHPEFAALGGVVPYLAASVDPIEPATSLRARVRDAIEAEAGRSSARAAGAGATTGASERDARTRRGRWTPLRLGLAGLSVAVVVLAGSTLYLANQLDQSRAYADQLAAVARLATVPGSRTAVLSAGAAGAGVAGLAVLPGPGAPSAPGRLVVDGLVPTAGSQVYEVWLIAGTAAPAPVGAFTVGPGGQGWFVGLPATAAGRVTIALTREPGPGATTPTLPIVASGTPTS